MAKTRSGSDEPGVLPARAQASRESSSVNIGHNEDYAQRVQGVLAGQFDFGNSALLLDVDGTLLDIAPAPDKIQVPERLQHSLCRLRERLSGAIALISGRSLSDLDLIFAPLRLAAIGGHGAEMRLQDGGITLRRAANPLEQSLRDRLYRVAQGSAAIVVEDKEYSLALHYRVAPELKRQLREQVAQACADSDAEDIEILHGKCVIEVKSAHFDKGTAVQELMTHAPFHFRRPIFLGDDVTDEDVFRILPMFDGIGLPVGRAFDGIASAFATPQMVREWLAELAHTRFVP